MTTSEESPHKTIVCPSCLGAIVLASEYPKRPTKYCIYCGSALYTTETQYPTETGSGSLLSDSSFSATLVPGHLPETEPIQFNIGLYQVIKKIGKGGMGEVFLAYDTSCGRRIALKRIRQDLVEHKALHHRFLKEARITSQLNHPGIIPIYSIHAEGNLIYYTMPYVEGETLKQLLRRTRALEGRGGHPHFGTISALIRHFIVICQAINLAHSKGVLHRDIKPENIIIGRYGEVMILDWGLAKLLHTEEEEVGEEFAAHPLHSLTHLGKVVGTLSYMAPERALGSDATFLTDIYALGVILYQILTLQLPFKRKSLKEYPKIMKQERLIPPEEMAPYRDVPKALSVIAAKCLDPDPSRRFQSVDELLFEIQNFIEGRSEWFLTEELNIDRKECWKFQEHVLIAEHTAITRHTEGYGWANLMFSKHLYMGHTKIEAEIKFHDRGQGIGFLFGMPEEAMRDPLSEGYCLWIASDLEGQTVLTRSAVEVYHAPELFLEKNRLYRIRIEKIDYSLYYFVDDKLQFSYISHQPLQGPHIGLLLRDAHLEITSLKVYEAGQNVNVNCLAVPDAFFAHKHYPVALTEYRRIGQSFPGRAEGREALFRAGLTLLEQARLTNDEQLFDAAIAEFEKLHDTPGAPLEYLGKALVYEALGDYVEEVKCFELACRRYTKHPLLQVLEEQIVYRMHESSMWDRMATYLFILLMIRQLPDVVPTPHAQKLIRKVQKHWEPLYFIASLPHEESPYELSHLAIQIAYHVSKPYAIGEILIELIAKPKIPLHLVSNALFCLIEMGAKELAYEQILLVDAAIPQEDQEAWSPLKELAMTALSQDPIGALKELLRSKADLSKFAEQRTAYYLAEQALFQRREKELCPLIDKMRMGPLVEPIAKKIESLAIETKILLGDYSEAKALIRQHPSETLLKESSHLHFLYGLILLTTENEKVATVHFNSTLEVPYPRSWTLGSHLLSHNIDLDGRWGHGAFHWEKRALFLQMGLYAHSKMLQEESLWFDRVRETYFDLGL